MGRWRREGLTWWAERCRLEACRAVCSSRRGMLQECCEGCPRRWSCPGWSTLPGRLMPHECSEPCSTAGGKVTATHSGVIKLGVYSICGFHASCQVLPCQLSLLLPAISVWSSRDYSHACQTVSKINHSFIHPCSFSHLPKPQTDKQEGGWF